MLFPLLTSQNDTDTLGILGGKPEGWRHPPATKLAELPVQYMWGSVGSALCYSQEAEAFHWIFILSK